MLNNKKLFKILRNIKMAVKTPPKALARGGCPHPPDRPINFLFFFEQLHNSHFIVSVNLSYFVCIEI